MTLEHEREADVYAQPVTTEVARLRQMGVELDDPETVAVVAELAWWRKRKKQLLKELKQRRDREARNVTAPSQPAAEQDETEWNNDDDSAEQDESELKNDDDSAKPDERESKNDDDSDRKPTPKEKAAKN